MTDARDERALRELFEFLRIPSVSADPAASGAVRRAAEFVRQRLVDAGFDAATHETGGHPLVWAEHRGAGPDAPTVLVYGHYDVQPPEPLEAWTTPPFEPTLVDGEIRARGAMDDKGQIYAHVKGAQAVLEADGTLPVNLMLLIEGEEEVGSAHLEAFVRAHAKRLAADVVVISDGAMIAPATPTIAYGQRGLAYVELRLRTADADLHSGTFGGAVPNAIHALAGIVDRLHDEDGRVAIPGFYDRVRPIDAQERKLRAHVPWTEQAFLRDAGVRASVGERGYGLLDRLWSRPTLDVNGISGGYEGEGAKTVIGATAMAKISCRLVPDQTHEEVERLLAAHLEALAPPWAEVEVAVLEGSDPVVTPLDGRGVRAAARALRQVWGKEPVFARSGGSLPVVKLMQDVLGVEVVLVGFGLETDHIHAPNEKFDRLNYLNGIRTSAALLRELGAG